MTEHTLSCAVLFADIAGSTRLYETLGDREARHITGTYLATMASIVLQHRGVIIKTIGDEIMCRFPTADQAVQAACEIQQAVAAGLVDNVPLNVHAGLHYGPVIMENNDIFGDAVNTAARLVSIGKAGQIMTTEETVQQLSPQLRSKTRYFDTTTVKGKQEELKVFQVLWEEEHLTRIIPLGFIGASKAPENSNTLTLLCADRSFTLSPDMKPLVLGREAQYAELVVPAGFVSRVHATIECRRGKYIFIDQSTNGSFIRTQDGNVVYLRREEFSLFGEGVISLGTELDDSNPYLIYFFSFTPNAQAETV
ncbi:MAG: adenylate/guanylate cyclase domain-containing protein [Gammaproteobacteria bacterium]